MYNAYLEIYDFAISIPQEEAPIASLEATEQESKVPLVQRLGYRYLWAYWIIYFFLYGCFVASALLIPAATVDQQGRPVEVPGITSDAILGMIIGVLVLSALHGWIVYWRVRKYHRLRQTEVYEFGKLAYDDIYPKPLRRQLLLWNALPFVYFTFAVVPIVTRIQYLVGATVFARVATGTQEGRKDANARLTQHNLIKNFIGKRIQQSGNPKTEALNILRILFERRISEIMRNVQRISIILSSLGIAISLIAFMVKDPVGEILKSGRENVIEIVIIVSVVGLIIGVAIYFISQLQIQIGKSRDLSVVLDTIDVMVTE